MICGKYAFAILYVFRALVAVAYEFFNDKHNLTKQLNMEMPVCLVGQTELATGYS